MGFHDATGKYIRTRQAKVPLPVNSFHLADGTPLAAFADGANATPGLALDDSESAGIRWNNHASPLAVVQSIALPNDMRPNTNVILRIPASKTGATVGDATAFTVAAFQNAQDALRDADSDFGGDSDAMVGDAATKTMQEVSFTFSAEDVSPGGNITLSIKPKDGTLGTDDVTMSQPWFEYTQMLEG